MRARLVWLALTASIALATSGCASAPRRPPPGIEQIVEMSQQGVAPEAIIEQMREARAVYRLPASELAKLKQRGVSDAVLDHMQQTYLNDERARGYYQGGPYWGPYWGPYGYWWGPPPPVIIVHRRNH